MTYYRVTDLTWWLIEANSETEAIQKIMEDQDAPDPVQSNVVEAKEISASEFHE